MNKNRFRFMALCCVTLNLEAISIAEPPPYNPQVVIDEAFPPIVNAPIVRADEVSTSVVTDNELVLGVVVNGKARAYPINMITGPQREIINDELGARKIAATW